MRLNSSFLYTQLAGNLAIGTGRQNQIEHLPFTLGQVWRNVGEAAIGNPKQVVNQLGENPPRRPNGAAGDFFNSLA